MCLDAETVCLYKHFLLCRSNLLSTHFRVACAISTDKEETDGAWKDRVFTSIMKEYKNWVLSTNTPSPFGTSFVPTFTGGWRHQMIWPQRLSKLANIVMCLSSNKSSTTSWYWINFWNSSRSVTLQTILSENNANTRLLKIVNVRRQTDRRTLPKRNGPLLVSKIHWATTMIVNSHQYCLW